MTKFNPHNKGHLVGRYPLFFGEQLGLADTVNVTYPQLESLYQKQLAQIWNEHEIDITRDLLEMQTLPKSIVEPMKQTIAWQSLADAVAARSVSSLLMPHVTNPELEHLINLWAFFETIHNRTYAHIVKQTFENPVEMIQEVYDNTQVLLRSEAIVRAFDELDDLRDSEDIKAKRKALLRAVVALFGLEGIAFMGSFAVTFAIYNSGVFQGIGKLVEMICKDEVMHIRFDYALVDILKGEPEWAETIAECVADGSLQEVLDAIVEQELAWAEYIFSQGQIVGLTTELLKEYILYMALPIYKVLGIPFKYQVITETPLKYMNKYIDTSMIQVANQEMQSGQYQVNATVDDTAGMTFDDEDFLA